MSGTMTQGWDVPDVFFSAAQQTAAHEVVHRDLGGPDRIGLAFLGGSLAVGLGHATSDLDLYVVGDQMPERQTIYERNGAAVHAAVLRPELIHQVIGCGRAYRATGIDREQLNLDIRSMHGLVRFVTGWRLVCTPSWTAALDLLRRDVVRQILISRHALGFADLADDVGGALASGDLHTAVRASGLALEAAAEGILAAADDIYWGPKFLFRRLSRTAVTRGWAPVLWRLLNQAFPEWPEKGELASGDAAGDADRVRRMAECRLRVGGLLLSWCAVEGWDHPLETLPSPPESRPGQAGYAGSSRSPYYVPVRFADGLALVGPKHGYEVNEAMVRLWRDGSSATPGADETQALEALEAIGAIGTTGADGVNGVGAATAPARLPSAGRGRPASAFRIQEAAHFAIQPGPAPDATARRPDHGQDLRRQRSDQP